MANTFEALIGAIYLDQGYDTARQFVKKELLFELPRIIRLKLYLDPKSKLQEQAQEKFNITPTYQVLKEWGPDHARRFLIGVYLEDKLVGKGEGTSKQEAQVAAAREALRDNQWEIIYKAKKV